MASVEEFKVDEGYSEHPMGSDDQSSEMASTQDGTPDTGGMVELLLAQMNKDELTECTYRMLQRLPTSTVAHIINRLTPRLHLDPVLYMPPEITSQIFSYLSPEMLLAASAVSKEWRERTLDTSLWRRKFVNEGWYLNIPKVLQYERDNGRAGRKPLSRRAVSDADSRMLKKRAVSPSSLRPEPAMSDIATNGSVINHSEPALGSDDDEEMTVSPTGTTTQGLEQTNTHSPGMSDKLYNLTIPQQGRGALLTKTPSGDSRVDYQKLYRIKSQLEENWMQARYKSFQFPHKDFPNESHSECVYTIQFSGKHLVSGSRDRTIRIWDLETCRLVRRPLSGHKGSVLSLQFDESTEEDIIASGSSDHTIGIWRFSTGELLQRLQGVHEEAVLCVRFDKRYLASCSKDKLIKIFNRRQLKPGDVDYPIVGVPGGGKFPDYIIDTSHFGSVEDFEKYLKPEQMEPLQPYTHIMTIKHHSAAVNALQIHENQLASGSGDKTAQVFNLRTGAVETNCRMHLKGVACIEYDGARLVSGSSDRTIRIFDPATNAEVGELKAHGNLVRTIQIDFGDAPGSRESLEEEAMLADQAYLDSQPEALLMARLARQERHELRRHRHPIPLVQKAIGAKLPPGGGGNRWSRIVSGSYDETVIVWRREGNGRWVVGQRYPLSEALRAAGPPILALSEQVAIERARRQRLAQHRAQAAPFMAGNAATPGPSASNGAAAAANAAAVTHQGTGAMPLQGQVDQQQQQVHNAATQQQQIQQLQQALLTPQHQNPVAVAAAAAAAAAHASGNARAFKLQFDARRIICCSQDPKIVGWDFANGSQDIVEGAKFFTRMSHYARGG